MTTKRPAKAPLTLVELGDRYVAKILQQTDGRITGKGRVADLLGVKANTVRSRARRAARVQGGAAGVDAA